MSGRGARTYYDILGLPRDANQKAIKQAWRRLVRDAHPDRGGSAAQFDAVQRAYEVLRDTNTRTEYDRSLRQRERPEPAPQPTQHRSPPRPTPTDPVEQPARRPRRVVLPEHTVPPLSDDLLPSRSTGERFLWWIGLLALSGLVGLAWLEESVRGRDTAVTVAVCAGVLLGLAVGTSLSRRGVALMSIAWLVASLMTSIAVLGVVGELVGDDAPSQKLVVTLVGVAVAFATLGTTWAATLTRRRRVATRRVRERYQDFVGHLDERRRRAQWWMPMVEAEQQVGAGLWWVWFATTVPGFDLTSAVLDSPDGAYRTSALLWGRWPQGTWIVVDSTTGQVLASAPDAARLAWDELWRDPHPAFPG